MTRAAILALVLAVTPAVALAGEVITAGISSSLAAPSDVRADGDLIGELLAITANEEDTLVGIARRHDLGFVELLAANPGIDPWLPGPGTTILLPAAHLLPERGGAVSSSTLPSNGFTTFRRRRSPWLRFQ